VWGGKFESLHGVTGPAEGAFSLFWRTDHAQSQMVPVCWLYSMHFLPQTGALLPSSHPALSSIHHWAFLFCDWK